MRRTKLELAVSMAAIACAGASACLRPHPSIPRLAGPYLPFDVVPQDYDPNGLPLNPVWGMQREALCRRGPERHAGTTCGAPDELPCADTLGCVWRFADKTSTLARDLNWCTRETVDTDLSTHWTTDLDITCRDGELHLPGHINFGRNFGGGATFEGWAEWETYSGPFAVFGDWDYNFRLFPDGGSALTMGTGRHRQLLEGFQDNRQDQIGLEIDSREMGLFGSRWWRGLFSAVLSGEDAGAAKYLGRHRAIATGLLGIDAEHYHVELHPLYAIAMELTRPDDRSGCAEWAIFAREFGNEGLCSHGRTRPLALAFERHTYKVRLPWRGDSRAELSIRQEDFWSTSKGEGKVTVSPGPGVGVLVEIEVPLGGSVDGTLVLGWGHESSSCERQGPAVPSSVADDREQPGDRRERPDEAWGRLSASRQVQRELETILGKKKKLGRRIHATLGSATVPPPSPTILGCSEAPIPPRCIRASEDKPCQRDPPYGSDDILDQISEAAAATYEYLPPPPEVELCTRTTTSAEIMDYCRAANGRGLNYRGE